VSTICGLPTRLFVYITAVTSVALPLAVASLVRIGLQAPSWSKALIVLLFFALSLGADLRPVPMDEHGKSEVSIASVFIVTAAILFGWEYAVPLAALSIGITYIVNRRSLAHTIFNASMYGISAFAAALPTTLSGSIHGPQVGRITVYVLLGGAAHLAVNVILVAGAIALSQGVPYRKVVLPGLRDGGGAFTIMVLLAALAANLWVTRPWHSPGRSSP
jgi:hypothetical protein